MNVVAGGDVPGVPKRDLSPKERVYQQLKDWIIYSRLAPGTLLNERELAERFGISRTPLREILQRLSYQRLIEIRPRKGIFVASIDYFTVKSVFEVRLPIEMTSASLAAQRATPEDVEALARIVEHSREARDRGESKTMIQLDRQFHEKMAEIARNRVMQEILEDLHNVCLRFWYLSHDMIGASYRSVEELESILDAIRRGNGSLAARLQAEHMTEFLAQFGDESALRIKDIFPLPEE